MQDNRACNEDKGFANPWTKVRFENAGMILEENRAIAMGNYFTDLDGNEAKAEYTFGYKLSNGQLKLIYIILLPHTILVLRFANPKLLTTIRFLDWLYNFT